MSERVIWAKNEAEAEQIRARVPGATVQVRAAKQKSAETASQRAARQARNSEAKGAHQAALEASRAPKATPRSASLLHRAAGVRVPGGRLTAGAALVGAGLGAGYAAGKIDKADRKTAERTAVGAGGAYGAYLGAGYGINRATRALSRGDKESNILMGEHRKKLGLPEGGLARNASPKQIEEFYRTIPGGVKYAGTRRMLARTHGQSAHGRMGAAVALAGGAAGVAYDHAKGNVSKGTNLRDYPALPENIREWRQQYIPVRRNPVSPLEMLSAGILMAQASAAEKGVRLTETGARRRGGARKTYAEGRMMLFQPLGRGVMGD